MTKPKILLPRHLREGHAPHLLLRRTAELFLPARAFGVTGRFRLLKHKMVEKGQRVLTQDTGWFREVQYPGATPWFPNLVLDAGLNRWGTGGILLGGAVGTGTTAPDAAQTSLVAESTYTTTTGTGHNTVTAPGASPYNNSRIVAYRTALGALNGSYTEVGVGWASGSMFSRALILDGLGSPTSISVASDEQLDIVYELSLYPPLSDITYTGVTITGSGTHDITGRAANVNGTASTTGWQPGTSTSLTLQGNTSQLVYSSTIGAITGTPSGTSDNATSALVNAYVNNSLSRSGTATWGLTDGNVGGIRSVSMQWGSCRFQYQIDAAVAKDSTKTFVFGASMTWARHT